MASTQRPRKALREAMRRAAARLGLVASVVVIAVGAFLLWGVSGSIGGVDASTIGVIVIVLGGIGALWSLVFRSRSSRHTSPDYDDEERLTTLPR
jgi:hypothetical protein